jgi:hypothetical protein
MPPDPRSTHSISCLFRHWQRVTKIKPSNLMRFIKSTYGENSSISSSEKPAAFSLSLCSCFSSSLALRARPLSAIVSTTRPGFCVYKAQRVIPIPKVTPSKNVSRTVDFISAPPSTRTFFTFQMSTNLHRSIGMTLFLSLKVKGKYPLAWYNFVPASITSCYHNSRLQTRVFTRMHQSGAMGEMVSGIFSGSTA